MSETFRYFANPHAFANYSAAPSLCALCERILPAYRGPFGGMPRESLVCDECLATGRLEAADATTNMGDQDALRAQLRALRPELSADKLNALVESRTATLEHCTPRPVTWQDFRWPAHCGDYCRHVKEVGKLDLAQLDPDGNGMHFLARHVLDTDPEEIADLWHAIRPDSPADRHGAYSLGMYLFQCLTCALYVITWDCD